MLTSFGCEQIVQVRAMRFDSKSALGLRSLKTYSGTGSRAQPRKGPSIAGVTRRLPRCVVLGLLEFRVLRLGFLQDRGCPESASVNANLVLFRQEAVLTIFRSR